MYVRTIRGTCIVFAALLPAVAVSEARAEKWIRYFGSGTSYGTYCTPGSERLETFELMGVNLNGEVLILDQHGARRGWGSNGSGVYSWPPGAQWPDGYLRDFPDPATSNLFFRSQVSLGNGHAAAIADGLVGGWYSVGTVVCWGLNDVGQCDVPLEPSGNPQYQIVQVSCGAKHTVALRSNGQVRAWGLNSYGQAVVPSSLFKGLPGVVQVAGGGLHSMALRADGSIICWGAGSASDPVDNFYRCGQSDPPVSLGQATSIAAGAFHSVALRSDGSVVCWGAGSNESTINWNMRQSMVPADLPPCTRIAAGAYSTAALQADGVVRVWGWDQSHGYCFGQCDVPATIGLISDVRSTYLGTLVVSNQERPACPADVEASCRVDGADLGALLTAWGQQSGGSLADINEDGVVNGVDLGMLLVAWGPCAP